MKTGKTNPMDRQGMTTSKQSREYGSYKISQPYAYLWGPTFSIAVDAVAWGLMGLKQALWPPGRVT
jgi:hypothetical protein